MDEARTEIPADMLDEIIEGDCLKVMRRLPDGCVDAVITDPPYSDVTHTGARTGKGDRRLVDFSSIAEVDLRERLSAAARVCRSWVIATVDYHHIGGLESSPPNGLRFVRFGVWIKGNAAPQFTGDRPGVGWEAVAILHKSGQRLSWNDGGHHAVWSANKENGPHPTMKPVSLIMKWVEAFTNPGDIILDPFCGSGTTCVAAKRLGRHFIGIELDGRYCEIARNRVRDTERPLFEAAGAVPQASGLKPRASKERSE